VRAPLRLRGEKADGAAFASGTDMAALMRVRRAQVERFLDRSQICVDVVWYCRDQLQKSSKRACGNHLEST
jgi:hypothetical protein